MQSGFGRTGYKFLYEYYNLNPDIMCCGKAMGSGFPLSGVISNSKIMNIPKIGDMSSTHSANPIVCSAGLATLEEIKSKKLIIRSKKLGKLLEKELYKIKELFTELISIVNCKGLIAAIIFRNYKNKTGTELANLLTIECYKQGLLLVNTGRESVKLGPPLVITKSSLLKATQIIHNSIKKIKFLLKNS
jgi:4-aminobutyrate aminotransferase-like enzyme